MNDYNKYPLNTFNQNNQPKVFQFKEPFKALNPDVLSLPKPTLTFVGNLNHSNIYQATPDKMYIIKPDSTFKSNMPIADIN